MTSYIPEAAPNFKSVHLILTNLTLHNVNSEILISWKISDFDPPKIMDMLIPAHFGWPLPGDGPGGPAPTRHVVVPLGHLRRLRAAAGAGDPRRRGGAGGDQRFDADADAWRSGWWAGIKMWRKRW